MVPFTKICVAAEVFWLSYLGALIFNNLQFMRLLGVPTNLVRLHKLAKVGPSRFNPIAHVGSYFDVFFYFNPGRRLHPCGALLTLT